MIGANGRRLAEANRADAIARASELFPIVVEFRSSGLSYRQMVQRLNERHEPTPGGAGRWHVRTLQRLVARAPEAEAHLAHEIIARSDAAEQVAAQPVAAAVAPLDPGHIESVLETARQLRQTQRALAERAIELMAHNRALCQNLLIMRSIILINAAGKR